MKNHTKSYWSSDFNKSEFGERKFIAECDFKAFFEFFEVFITVNYIWVIKFVLWAFFGVRENFMKSRLTFFGTKECRVFKTNIDNSM